MFVASIVRPITKLLPLVYMACIWYLSGQPARAVIDLGAYDQFVKETLHLIEFGILYLLWVLALLAWGKSSARANWLAILLAVSYSLVDELHQAFVPSRSASIIDFIKDITGVVGVWYIFNHTYYCDHSRLGRWLRRFVGLVVPYSSNNT